MVRAMTAYLTGIPQSDIRAIPAEIGGGFGGKTIVYLEPLATLLAKKSGRPVKMVMTREEVMRATGPTSGSKSTVKIGARKDGTHRRRPRHLLSAGRRVAGLADPRRGRLQLCALRHSRTSCRSAIDVVSNRSKVAAYRAPGAPIGAYAVECVMDELAEALKMDPLELRLKNAAKQGTKAAHGPVFPRIGYVETLEAAKAHPHYAAPLGKLQGRGVASGFWFNAGGESSAQVNITEDGNVVVTTGHPDIGGSRAGDRQYLRRAARHRLPPRLGPDRRHRDRRLLQSHRRQPRAVCLRDGGDAIDRQDHRHAARARARRSGRSIPRRSNGKTARRIRRAPMPASSRR